MHDFKHWMIALGINRLLPRRRAYAEIGAIEADQVAGIFCTNTRTGIDRRQTARIEVCVGAFCTIKEFEIADQRRVRKDILQIPDLAPSIMSNNDVGNKAGLLQLDRDTRDGLRVQDMPFSVAQIAMCLRISLACRPVHDFFDAGKIVCFPLGDKHHAVAWRRRQCVNKMFELSGKILMDE